MKSARNYLGTLALSLLLSTSAMVAQAEEASDKETLRVAILTDLKIIDPVWTTTSISIRYGYAVYDTLFSLDQKFNPQPQMVDTYEISDDKLTYTFKLREGLKFHDGQPVRAIDCVASINRWIGKDVMGQKLAEFIDTFEAVDDATFKLVLKKPYGLVLQTLAKPANPPFIMPERIARTPADTQIKEAIGSGPFKFLLDEWEPGKKAVFVKNEDYMPRGEPADYLSGGKVVNVDRMEWVYIPDNNTILAALRAGEIDYYEAPPLEYMPVLENDPDVKVVKIDDLGIQGVVRPNHLHPPFDKLAARRALLYLVNQSDFMQAAVGNPDYYLEFCGAYFMCNSANETEVATDPLKMTGAEAIEKAKELFKEAGYDGRPIVVFQPTDRPIYNAASMVMIQALRDAGLNVEPKAADWATISSMRTQKAAPSEGGWNLLVNASVGPATANPVSNGWFGATCDKAYPGWPCDEDMTKLIDDWSQATEPGKQKELLEAIQTHAYEKTVPYVSYGQYIQPVATRANITGVLKAGEAVYWNIDKE